MSAVLRAMCEEALLIANGQQGRDNTEFTLYNVIPFIYAARDKLLHQLLETGQVGRNYGSGKPGDLGVDNYTYAEMSVGDGYRFTIPSEYADLRANAGISVVPLDPVGENPFIQVAYGYQWSGSQIMNLEGRIAWWVNPSREVQFAKDPNVKKVGLIYVAGIPDKENISLDVEVKFPNHLHMDIVLEAANMINRQPVDQSVNNRDSKPS